MEMDNRSVRAEQEIKFIEFDEYMYPLVDRISLMYSVILPYEEVPKIAFNDRIVPHEMPEVCDYGYDIP